ncbi:MAG: hypothetical protein CEN90_341 [Parcubacteria group bacterium Licking1014_17]|nr:MAG: hypothetical protein CEN90_341 [Parcubacteria group bacterium Licking1014_17]
MDNAKIQPVLNRARLLFILSLLFKLIIAATVIWRFGQDIHFTDNDATQYLNAGINLFRHGVFSMDAQAPLSPTMFRTPLYPIFLFAVNFLSGRLWVVSAYVLQGLIISFAVVYLYRGIKNIFGEKPAFWSAFLFALEPFSNFNTNIITPDSIFTALITIASVAFLKVLFKPVRRNLVISAVALALAVLTKPIAEFIPVLFLIAFFLKWGIARVYIKKAIVFVAVFVVIISPWVIRNYVDFKSLQISSLPSYNLYLYNAALALASQKNISFTKAQNQLMSKAEKDLGISGNMDLYDPKYGNYLRQNALQIIGADPLDYVAAHILTICPFLINDGYQKFYPLVGINFHNSESITLMLKSGNFKDVVSYVFGRSFDNMILFGIGKLFWVVIYAFILCNIYRRIQEKNKKSLIALAFFAIVIAYFAVLTGPVAAASYRLPVQGLIFLLIFI